jgi:conjugative relaxase-like TrwC/TraI family protein
MVRSRRGGGGATAPRCSVSGEVDEAAFLAVMGGVHPATGSRLGRRYGEESVRGFDATFSAPKSASVLFGVGDDATRREVTERSTPSSIGSRSTR